MKARIIETSDVAKAMPLNSVLIEYQKFRPFKFDTHDDALEVDNWGPARYQALLLLANGEIDSLDLGLAEPIENKIQQALVASEEQSPQAQDLWKQVGELVIAPLTKATLGQKTWFISPDAELNRIPFAALSGPRSDQLLGELFINSGGKKLDYVESLNYSDLWADAIISIIK